MIKTLEWERKNKEQRKLRIMKLRFPDEIILELIEKGIAGFDDSYVLKHKKYLNEIRGMTKNFNNGGT